MVMPSLVRRAHIVWCIQQFDSQLSDVVVCLLSRQSAAELSTSKQVSHDIAFELLIVFLILSHFVNSVIR